MIRARFKKHRLRFKTPSGTSRGILKSKDSWYIALVDDATGRSGIGECSIIEGLSLDNPLMIDAELSAFCKAPDRFIRNLDQIFHSFPAIRTAIEMANLDMQVDDPHVLLPSAFTQGKAGILINGLIWMGEKNYMYDQIKTKITQGFQCIKLKIGAIDFQHELSLLAYIRKHFSPSDVELRVDANGAFAPAEALERLKDLSEYHLHSIEQPIKQGQSEEMARLCQLSPIDIALDEELIGVSNRDDRMKLLEVIMPQYIILKPSLLGGLGQADQWIDIAEALHIKWWATSALESNVGLSAISQWAYHHQPNMPQGLGTGQLFENNIQSPLYLAGQYIQYNPASKWDNIF